MQRGGARPRDARKEVDEETLDVAQEGALTLHAPKLLEERQRQDLGVRELLKRLVASPPRVDGGVGVVHEAEQERDRLFQGRRSRSSVWVGHPNPQRKEPRMALFLLPIHATHI